MDVKIEKEQKQQVVEVMKSRRSSIRYTAPTVKKIVICNIKLCCDNHTFNKGGLWRCEQEQSKEKLRELFAVDVYYHKKCYSGFTYIYQLRESFTENQEVEDKLLHWFFPKIKVRVLKNKEASLLTKLLLEIKEMSYKFS